MKRVEFRTTIEKEEIPFETVYKQSPLLKAGYTRILSRGIEGEREKTYTQKVVDGVVLNRQLTSDIVSREPISQLVLKGSPEPASNLDFGISLTPDGVPVTYKQLLTNQICTGYSASGLEARGASRMPLSCGYVAVRANEIPYGTKLYITSADNSFVYGFAIAADTGTGLMAGIIDFDLFYDSYEESRLNGRKYLNVYVLS